MTFEKVESLPYGQRGPKALAAPLLDSFIQSEMEIAKVVFDEKDSINKALNSIRGQVKCNPRYMGISLKKVGSEWFLINRDVT